MDTSPCTFLLSVKDILTLWYWAHKGLFELYLHCICTLDYSNRVTLFVHLVLPAFAQPDLPRSQGCLIQLSRLYTAKLPGDVTGIYWSCALPNLHNHLWWPWWACVLHLPETLIGTVT